MVRFRVFLSAFVLAPALALCMTAPPSPADARSKGKETILYYFCHQNNCASGSYPMGDLLLDGKGDLYGTTSEGGDYSVGTVFMLGKNGVESVLYSFCPQSLCPDGNGPVAGLLMDGSGNLFGTTQSGGQNNLGTVFELSGSNETVLHSFCTSCSDGTFPVAAVISDASGNLYGTTSSGGSDDDGVVFEIASNGSETVLHSFTRENNDGAFPEARLLMDKKGNLFGTTRGGGFADQGVIFKITPDGAESTAYAFGGGTDASYSVAGLIEDKKGNLYGTSQLGGQYSCGAVFKLARNGLESVVYSFKCGNDGDGPLADLIMNKAGTLFGTTSSGGGTGCGGEGCGTVFSVSSKGKEAVLYAFRGGNDGSYPAAGLVADASGNLYGTTRQGGTGGGGIVFKIEP